MHCGTVYFFCCRVRWMWTSCRGHMTPLTLPCPNSHFIAACFPSLSAIPQCTVSPTPMSAASTESGTVNRGFLNWRRLVVGGHHVDPGCPQQTTQLFWNGTLHFKHKIRGLIWNADILVCFEDSLNDRHLNIS